jgi:outer membrane biosynthesis protein TonB
MGRTISGGGFTRIVEDQTNLIVKRRSLAGCLHLRGRGPFRDTEGNGTPMKARLSNRLIVSFCTLGVLALATAGVALRARADVWNKKTVLTISEPIQISNTYLEPGTYVLKLVDSQSDRHIVRIMNADETKVIDTQLAIPNYRLEPTGNSRFQFWETPPGSAKALRAWFYPGDNFGQEFRYPKNLRTVAMVTSSAAAAPAPAPVATPAPAPEPQPEPAAAAPAAAPTPEPVPAPAPVNAEPAPAPAPQPAQAPTELPKTASPFPLIGLSGLLAAIAYGALRLKRV